MPKEPQVKRNLQATADLLDALQENPTLLNDEEFMRRLSILREKHEETTNFLAKKIGAPPLPTVITSSKTTESKTTNFSSKVEMMTTCHQRFIDPASLPCHLGLDKGSKESEYHEVMKSSEEPIYMIPKRQAPEPKLHTSPPKPRVPVRIAPAPPSRQPYRQASSVPQAPREAQQPPSRPQAPSSPKKVAPQRHQAHTAITTGIPRQHVPSRPETIRKILTSASAKHNLPTTSIAMPDGLLLSSTNTKHTPSQFATTSDVVEESFLEDGMSTTREVPTIVDDIVGDPHRTVKRQLETNGILKHRSKSMHNMADGQVTIPKPFQLSLRKSIGNTYAKKFMSDLISEKQRREEETQKSLANTKFKAKPVPKSTYLPTNTFTTEQKYVEAMRKKVAAVARKKFEAQNEMVRSKSEGNLSSIKPLGYVPPTTYVSPIPVKGNARGKSAATRTAIMIQEATTPKGIKSHRAQSNLTHHLRHGKCKLDTSAVVQHRRMSPPDFNKIHAKINEDYRRSNSKPSTVPIPFKFTHRRSQSATSRHTNCKEKEPEQFKPTCSPKSHKIVPNRVPSTHSAQLREELNRARIQKEKEDVEKNSFWAEDNKKRIASFLGARSKTDEDIAMRTKMKLQQQQETTQEYMRQLTEMKQRVLNGPLIMEKQSALAQEHRLKRKFEERMKANQKSGRSQGPKPESRRDSETSAAGTFVVEKEEEYGEEKFESESSSSGGKKLSLRSESSESEASTSSESQKSMSSESSQSSSDEDSV